MTVRNRLVMSPMETMYGTPDGLPSRCTRDYFAARANGGVGLITLGATGVDHHHPEMSGADVHAADDCGGVGLIRKATQEGARAACAI